MTNEELESMEHDRLLEYINQLEGIQGEEDTSDVNVPKGDFSQYLVDSGFKEVRGF